MPHRKPVGRRAQSASEMHSTDAERMPDAVAQNMSPAPLSASLSKAALRTVTSKWSMSMTCMGAWLGGRGLTYGGRHTHPKRKERQRAPPLTLYRAAASKRIASGVEGSAAARSLLRSSWRLGECNSQPARLVHSSDKPRFRRPVLCRGAARAFDRGLLHFSEKQTVHLHNAYLAVQHVGLRLQYATLPDRNPASPVTASAVSPLAPPVPFQNL
jgi:hypothetical protein